MAGEEGPTFVDLVLAEVLVAGHELRVLLLLTLALIVVANIGQRFLIGKVISGVNLLQVLLILV